MSDPAAEKEQGPPAQNDSTPQNTNGEKKKREYKEFGHEETKQERELHPYFFKSTFSTIAFSDSNFNLLCDLQIIARLCEREA